MPTQRFRYRTFTGIKIGNKYLNNVNAVNLSAENAILTGNVSLPETTTINGVPLGNIVTKNVTNSVVEDDTVVPTSSAVYNALNSLSNAYLPYIQQYQIPEFLLELPTHPIFINEEFKADFYATSTGPKDKYIKSMTCVLIYNSTPGAITGAVTLDSITNSRFYTVTQDSSVVNGTSTILTFTITENFDDPYLKKAYKDLHLCTLNFTFTAPGGYKTGIISQLQITSLLDGSDTDYLSSVLDEAVNAITFSGTSKVAYIKTYDNDLRYINGYINAGGFLNKQTMTNGSYGIGVNTLRLDTTTGEIQFSTT